MAARKKQIIKLENNRILLEVEIGDWINPSLLYDKKESLSYADSNYAYCLKIKKQSQIEKLEGKVLYEDHQFVKQEEWEKELTLTGRFEIDGIKTGIKIIQKFHLYLRDDAGLNETITLANETNKDYGIVDILFGFRKRIYNRVAENWAKNFEKYKLVFDQKACIHPPWPLNSAFSQD